MRCRETRFRYGTFTFALTSTLANYNYNQLDGTLRDGRYVLESFSLPLSPMMPSEPRLEQGLPRVRAETDDGSQAGRDV